MLNIFAFLLLCSTQAYAALPPLAQSSREIQAILESPQTYNLLGGADPIEQIDRTNTGYLIATKNKQLQVDVHYLRNGKIGPAQFELEFLPVLSTN